MQRRYVSIWFRHLTTDWFSLRDPHLKKKPFVARASRHGRMIITAANARAKEMGINAGMVLADARAVFPELEIVDDKPELIEKLLTRLAEWSVRFTPHAAIDPPDGIILDATGCSHLWGGDDGYLTHIETRLTERGYDVRAAIAETPGIAWAVARFSKDRVVIPQGEGMSAILQLPAESLRFQNEVVWKLNRLGLHYVRQFISLPRPSLRRRFGTEFLKRMDEVLGYTTQPINAVIIPQLYQERLPCLEPVVTSDGIEYALTQLLERLCDRLQQDQKGLRKSVFRCFRVDGKLINIDIATTQPSDSVRHLLKLFQMKIGQIEPGMGLELFILEAPVVDDHLPEQENMWNETSAIHDKRLCELVDRLTLRLGEKSINRFLPAEHYWPERSFEKTTKLEEVSMLEWKKDQPRPLHLLTTPVIIEVTAPIPDYPPILFRHKGKIHNIVKADGPERIEQEWWINDGQHRDYYRVEDEEGQRFWLFRSGHYHDKTFQWFLHGFFP